MVLCRDKGALTMKLKMKLLTGVILILFYAQGALSQSASLPAGSSEKDSQLLLEDVLKNVEKRYASSSFSTQFYQTLTLKSMTP